MMNELERLASLQQVEPVVTQGIFNATNNDPYQPESQFTKKEQVKTKKGIATKKIQQLIDAQIDGEVDGIPSDDFEEHKGDGVQSPSNLLVLNLNDIKTVGDSTHLDDVEEHKGGGVQSPSNSLVLNINNIETVGDSTHLDDVEEFEGGGVGKITHTSRLKDDNTNPNKESGKPASKPSFGL